MAQSLLGVFRYRVFAILWVATMVSNIGGWMYSAAAGWLMTTLTKDLTPSTQWPAPVTTRAVGGDDGPVLVTIEYRLARPADREAFLSALDRLQHERLRDGASMWGIFEDTAQSCRFLETFLVASWTEHLRQHQRVTNADYVLQHHINQLLQGEVQITHFIAPRP